MQHDFISAAAVLALCAAVVWLYLKMLGAKPNKSSEKADSGGTKLIEQDDLPTTGQVEVKMLQLNPLNMQEVKESFTIGRFPCSVGNNKGNSEYHLPKLLPGDESVSRVHFFLRKDEHNNIWIVDNHSTNKLCLLVNGRKQPIREKRIESEREIYFAGYQPLRFVVIRKDADIWDEAPTARVHPRDVSGGTKRYPANTRPPFRGGDFT